MKSHDDIRGMLPALAGDDLSETDRERVERHVADCPACRSELAELRAVVQAVRTTPEVEPPPWLAARIMARVREESAPRRRWWARIFMPVPLRLPLEGLALLIVCVFGWYLIQDPGRSPQWQAVAPPAQAPGGNTFTSEPASPAAQPLRQAAPASVQPSMPVPPPGREPAAEPVFAPPPLPAKDSTVRMERGRAVSEALPAPAAAPAQAAPEVAPTAGHKAATNKHTAEMADRTLSAVAGPSLRLRLAVADREAIPEQLQDIAHRLGGTVADSGPGRGVVRVEAGRLPDLLDQLARLGRVIERPEGALTREGSVSLQVLW